MIGAVLLLTSCAAPPISPSDAPSFGEVKIRFMAARDDQVIEARALDRRAITAAALVFPDGTRVPAYSIDAAADPAVGGMATGVTPRTSTRLIGQIASSALIRVLEPALYAQIWRRSTIELKLGTGPDAATQISPAPAPL